MNIETKFKIKDLVSREFENSSDSKFTLLQVLEIMTQTCYAGTQVFYFCRPIIGIARINYSKSDKKEWDIAHGVSAEDNQIGWRKYREDELVEAKKELVEIVKSNKDGK